MTLKERVVLFLKHKDISQGKFEKITQLPNGFVNNIGVGINTQSLIKILKTFPELNANWLLTESGDMLLKEISGMPPDYVSILIKLKDVESIKLSLDVLTQAFLSVPRINDQEEKAVQQLVLGKRRNKKNGEDNQRK